MTDFGVDILELTASTGAVHWFLKGALNGYGDDSAIKCLAAMLRAGMGVAKDEAAADDFDRFSGGARDPSSTVKIAAEAASIGSAANADLLWNSLAALWYWSAGCDGSVVQRQVGLAGDAGDDCVKPPGGHLTRVDVTG